MYVHTVSHLPTSFASDVISVASVCTCSNSSSTCCVGGQSYSIHIETVPIDDDLPLCRVYLSAYDVM